MSIRSRLIALSTSNASSRPKMKASSTPGIRSLTEDILDGFALSEIACRACTGFGNCGFKQYFLHPEDEGVVSICMMTRKQLQCRRDRIPFSIDLV